MTWFFLKLKYLWGQNVFPVVDSTHRCLISSLTYIQSRRVSICSLYVKSIIFTRNCSTNFVEDTRAISQEALLSQSGFRGLKPLYQMPAFFLGSLKLFRPSVHVQVLTGLSHIRWHVSSSFKYEKFFPTLGLVYGINTEIGDSPRGSKQRRPRGTLPHGGSTKYLLFLLQRNGSEWGTNLGRQSLPQYRPSWGVM